MDIKQNFSKFFIGSFVLHGIAAVALCFVIFHARSTNTLKGGLGGQGAMWVGLTGEGGGSIKTLVKNPATPRIARTLSPVGIVPAALPEDSQNTVGDGVGAPGGGDGLPFGSSKGDWSNPLWSQIRARIESSKFYPQLARRQGIVGTSHARFRIGQGGIPENISIEKTSGSSLLDEATIAAIKRAAPFPSVPGWVSFPLTYDLKSKES